MKVNQMSKENIIGTKEERLKRIDEVLKDD